MRTWLPRSRQTGRWLLASGLTAVVVLTAGCGTQAAPEGLVGSWTDSAGRPAPDGTEQFGGTLAIRSFLAAPSCEGPKDVVYLEVAWPPGKTVNIETQKQGDTRFFVRDTKGTITDARGAFDSDVPLPTPASEVTFQREGNKIVFDADGMPIVERADGHGERWPEVTLGCA